MKPRPHHHHDQNNVKHHGDRAYGIHNAHHYVVHAAAAEARYAAIQYADYEVDHRRNNANQQGHSCAVYNADKHIPAQRIAAPDVGFVGNGFEGAHRRAVIGNGEPLYLLVKYRPCFVYGDIAAFGRIIAKVFGKVVNVRNGYPPA